MDAPVCRLWRTLIVRQGLASARWRGPNSFTPKATQVHEGKQRKSPSLSPYAISRLMSLGLHLAADVLGLAEDAQQVAAENLAYVAGAVAAIEQRLRDLRQIGG